MISLHATPGPVRAYRRSVVLVLLRMTGVALGPLWVWLVFGETAGLFTLAGGALLLAAIAGDAVTGIRDRTLATMQ